MDFQPPTTAEQGATAARAEDLRAEDLRADVLNLASLWADAYAHKTDEKARWIKMADALDTLIQYHRAAGAVEACKEGVTRFCPPGSALRETCGQEAMFNGKTHKRRVCGSHLMLAAAQARLAAYEEERCLNG